MFVNFLYWEFRFHISLAVKLRCLYKASQLTVFVYRLEYNAVCWDLLFVIENDDVTNFYILKLSLDNTVGPVF